MELEFGGSRSARAHTSSSSARLGYHTYLAEASAACTLDSQWCIAIMQILQSETVPTRIGLSEFDLTLSSGNADDRATETYFAVQP
jgi:hypothetical protein